MSRPASCRIVFLAELLPLADALMAFSAASIWSFSTSVMPCQVSRIVSSSPYCRSASRAASMLPAFAKLSASVRPFTLFWRVV